MVGLRGGGGAVLALAIVVVLGFFVEEKFLLASLQQHTCPALNDAQLDAVYAAAIAQVSSQCSAGAARQCREEFFSSVKGLLKLPTARSSKGSGSPAPQLNFVQRAWIGGKKRLHELWDQTHCCHDMITGKCTREFGPAERAVQDSIMAAWSFTSPDMTLNKILEEVNRNLARVAACGEPIAISQVNHKRGCGVGKDPAFCALSKFPGGKGHVSHPDAVSRQAAYVGCLRTTRATPAPADIIHCLNMPRAVTCAHTYRFGSEEDPCTVCITEEFFKDNCTLYAIGVGFSWEVENQLADWFPKCTILMFDPTPESGPHEILNKANMPASETYRAQVVISGRQRHANIWMHALGVSDKDQVMVFKNHFLKGPGVPTGLLSPGSLLKLHGPTREHPLMLKLDVEGLEFTFMDQLLDLTIPQLNIDFHMDESTEQHPFKLDALTRALIKLAEAGYYAVGSNICNEFTKDVEDGSCIGASQETSSHDFRTHQGKTYIHLDFVRAAQRGDKTDMMEDGQDGQDRQQDKQHDEHHDENTTNSTKESTKDNTKDDTKDMHNSRNSPRPVNDGGEEHGSG